MASGECRTSADCALDLRYSEDFENMRKEAQAVAEAQRRTLDGLMRAANALQPYVHRLNSVEERMLHVEEAVNAARELLQDRMDASIIYEFVNELERHLRHQPSVFKDVLPAAELAARNAGVPDVLQEYEQHLRTHYRMHKQAMWLRYHADKAQQLAHEIRRMTTSLEIKESIVRGMRVPNTTCCPGGHIGV